MMTDKEFSAAVATALRRLGFEVAEQFMTAGIDATTKSVAVADLVIVQQGQPMCIVEVKGSPHTPSLALSTINDIMLHRDTFLVRSPHTPFVVVALARVPSYAGAGNMPDIVSAIGKSPDEVARELLSHFSASRQL